jgi:hypothetical protein
MVGIVLFFYFWIWVYKKLKIIIGSPYAVHLHKIGLMIILFIFIESVAGSAFLQGSGIVVMILLGFVVRDISVIREKETRVSKEAMVKK